MKIDGNDNKNCSVFEFWGRLFQTKAKQMDAMLHEENYEIYWHEWRSCAVTFFLMFLKIEWVHWVKLLNGCYRRCCFCYVIQRFAKESYGARSLSISISIPKKAILATILLLLLVLYVLSYNGLVACLISLINGIVLQLARAGERARILLCGSHYTVCYVRRKINKRQAMQKHKQQKYYTENNRCCVCAMSTKH